MKFLADESVDGQIIERLRKDGHEVLYIAEMQPGTTDLAVLEIANRKKCVLLTADKDFGELIFRQNRITSGIILNRLAGFPPISKAELVAFVIEQHLEEFTGAFAVISPKSVRIRQP